MSQRGFANPALLGVIGAVVAGCTLFLYYEGSALKSSSEAPSSEVQPSPSADMSSFPNFTGATFVKKESVNDCKNIDQNHPHIPLCHSEQYFYSLPTGTTASQVSDWFNKAENTKPWTCHEDYCTNENGDQFEVITQSGQLIYKLLNYDSYTYLPDWQTVFIPVSMHSYSATSMYSYPQSWTVDDSGLKSPDYEKKDGKMTAGCLIDGTVPAVADSVKSTQTTSLLSDQNATFSSWQNPTNRMFYWEIKSKFYKDITLQSVTKEAGDACQDIFWKYAKSIKLIEDTEASGLILLETT